jgi:hypothetical protein
MTSAAEPGGRLFVDLEFDTSRPGGAQLGDIASSLVTLDELLRDLGTRAGADAEFRTVEIVAIETRNPLRVRLALFGISEEAVAAFQEICRHIILSRDGRARRAAWTPAGPATRITEQEMERLSRHVAALQHAAIPLRRVEVTKPG